MSHVSLHTLYHVDAANIKDPNLFITGSVAKNRPADSPKTPTGVAEKMFNTFREEPKIGELWLEPCAGQGGILEVLKPWEINVVFNEIKTFEMFQLKERFEKIDGDGAYFQPAVNSDSLENPPSIDLSFQPFDKVIMNPPFDQAHRFLRAAIKTWCKPGGEIVSLFPYFSLAKLTSEFETFLQLCGATKFSIEHLPEFECGYGAKVSLIHIIK